MSYSGPNFFCFCFFFIFAFDAWGADWKYQRRTISWKTFWIWKQVSKRLIAIESWTRHRSIIINTKHLHPRWKFYQMKTSWITVIMSIRVNHTKFCIFVFVLFLFSFLSPFDGQMYNRWAIREVWWNTFWLWARRCTTTWITFQCSNCLPVTANRWRPAIPAATIRRPPPLPHLHPRVRRHPSVITPITCPSSLELSLPVRYIYQTSQECCIAQER